MPGEEGGIMEFKGSMTEKNLLATFAGESQTRTGIVSFQELQKRKDLNRYPRSFLKHMRMKKSMRNFFLPS
jgi:rubrerythrin